MADGLAGRALTIVTDRALGREIFISPAGMTRFALDVFVFSR
jgi:hypothetical protein